MMNRSIRADTAIENLLREAELQFEVVERCPELKCAICTPDILEPHRSAA